MRAAPFVVSLLAGTIAACAGGDVVLAPRQLAAYDLGDLPYVARHGLLAEISGSPFGAGRDPEVGAKVAAALARGHFGPVFPVHLERPPGFVSPYRVVMVFDPRPAPGRATLCERVPASRTDGARIRLSAAFCAGEQLLSYVGGSVARTAGPDDPRFGHLLNQIATELFPPFDERGANPDEFLP